SGVFCAVGMLASDVEHTGLRTLTRRLDQVTAADLKSIKQDLQAEVGARLAADGYPEARRRYVWQADLRHEGQATELTVHFEGEDIAA
ncbi:hypothetical protein, partial [Enterococcus faecium]